MELLITPTGNAHGVYDETLDLQMLGRLSIHRASHVEPTDGGRWTANLAPVGGPVLGPFGTRSEALAAEVEWLRYWVLQGDSGGLQAIPEPAVERPASG